MAIAIVLKMLRNWYSKYWTWLSRKSQQGLLKKEGYACILEDLILKILPHPTPTPSCFVISVSMVQVNQLSGWWSETLGISWALRRKAEPDMVALCSRCLSEAVTSGGKYRFQWAKGMKLGIIAPSPRLPITLHLSCASSGHKPNRNPEDRNPEDRTGN